MEFESYFVAEDLQDVVATYYLVVGFMGLALAWGIWASAGPVGIIVAVTGTLVGVYPSAWSRGHRDRWHCALLLLPSVREYCG